MNYLDYIIDFDRINELSINQDIDKNVKENSIGHVGFSYSISRRVLKEYVDTFYLLSKSTLPAKFRDTDKINHIIKTLHYNKVLLSPADIRSKEIDKVLED